jgi:hypothetical protein
VGTEDLNPRIRRAASPNRGKPKMGKGLDKKGEGESPKRPSQIATTAVENGRIRASSCPNRG